MFVAVRKEDIHHVLLVGALLVAHFAGLAVGMPLDGVEHLAAAADLEYLVDLGERLLVQTAQGPGAVAHVDGRELAVNLPVVVVDPFPDGPLLGMQVAASARRSLRPGLLPRFLREVFRSVSVTTSFSIL